MNPIYTLPPLSQYTLFSHHSAPTAHCKCPCQDHQWPHLVKSKNSSFFLTDQQNTLSVICHSLLFIHRSWLPGLPGLRFAGFPCISLAASSPALCWLFLFQLTPRCGAPQSSALSLLHSYVFLRVTLFLPLDVNSTLMLKMPTFITPTLRP